MIAAVFAAIAVLTMVLVQDALPNEPVYHYGWYNIVIAALVIFAAVQVRGLRTKYARVLDGLVLALFGVGIVGFAGVTNGLLAPDTQQIVGTPGGTVAVDDLGGALVFPLASDTPSDEVVSLRRGNGDVAIPPNRRRYVGGFILWQEPHTVVEIAASDPNGSHLTITQPTNATFLSPVLLMQQHTTISGMDVSVDSFAVPGLRRQVRAVLFSPQQAALLRTASLAPGKAAVLFDVFDDSDRQIAGGIGMVPDGTHRVIGGVDLHANVSTYPAITIASAPNLYVLWLGAAVFFAGAARIGIRRRDPVDSAAA